MEEIITINKENVLNAYQQATEEQKELLENMFGKDMFQPKDIKELVKTFADACNVLGENHPLVMEYKFISGTYDIMDDLYAYLELRIICSALNEGWKPKFDENEQRYYPWFYIYTKKEYKELDEDEKKKCCVVGRSSHSAVADDGVVYSVAYYTSSHSYANFGSRLAFKTRELAEYCGKQFIDIWANYLFG